MIPCAGVAPGISASVSLPTGFAEDGSGLFRTWGWNLSMTPGGPSLTHIRGDGVGVNLGVSLTSTLAVGSGPWTGRSTSWGTGLGDFNVGLSGPEGGGSGWYSGEYGLSLGAPVGIGRAVLTSESLLPHHPGNNCE